MQNKIKNASYNYWEEFQKSGFVYPTLLNLYHFLGPQSSVSYTRFPIEITNRPQTENTAVGGNGISASGSSYLFL